MESEIMSKMITTKNRKAQEEIVGFAVIVIIVSIIIIFFLVFSLSDRTEVDSYEAESFLQSVLHYTSSCSENGRFLPVQDLVFSCDLKRECDGGEEACVVLNKTLKAILEESWTVGPDFPVKGYKMEILSGEETTETILSIETGNITSSSKGAQQLIPKGIQIRARFNLYY